METSLIDLDETHCIRPDLVLGIKPMFMPGEPGGPWVENPDRCQVLIGEDWTPVKRGVTAVRETLRAATPQQTAPAKPADDWTQTDELAARFMAALIVAEHGLSSFHAEVRRDILKSYEAADAFMAERQRWKGAGE